MKRIALILSAALFVLAAVSCNNAKTAETATEGAAANEGPAAGAIVYFNLDRVLEEYDMANDLRSVVETKVGSIQQEINRRGSKLEKDVKAFQDKIDKGLLTRSVAEVQGQKLQEQQNSFQQYAAQKQQEMAEEQQVMLNQIADAIKTWLDEFNAEKKYALIISTQGAVLPAPIATGDPELDITDEILEGLNAAYVKTKAKETK
jgi:outer membrane protein